MFREAAYHPYVSLRAGTFKALRLSLHYTRNHDGVANKVSQQQDLAQVLAQWLHNPSRVS